MPRTISVTAGRPEALLAAFDPVVVELLELPQAARPAVSAATLAALAILMRECLNIGMLLQVWGWTWFVLNSKTWAQRSPEPGPGQAPPAALGDGGRQDRRRPSRRPIRPSAVSARTAMMNIAPNTPFRWKLFCDVAITSPRPFVAPRNSPTIAPMIASPNATCRLALIQVSAEGTTP